MKQLSFILAGALLIAIVCAVSAMAQAPLIVNHQGRLLDGNNQPVNGTVNMIFTIWDDSIRGLSRWTETQDVLVRNGIFNVRLGQFNPFDPAIFNLPAVQLWLETQVGGETLVPRTLLNSVPFSFDTRSIRGDVQTGPGSIQISDPGISPSFVLIKADGDSSTMMLHPPDPGMPVLSLTNDASGANIVMTQPGPPQVALMTLSGTSTGSSLVMANPGPPQSPVLSLTNDASGANIVMTQPGPPDIPLMTLSGTAAATSLTMLNPGPPENSIQLKSVSGAGSIGIFDAAVPPNPFVEMSHDGTGSSLVMLNPGPPNSPQIQFNANANGRGVIAIERTNPGFPPSPCITLANNGTASSFVMNNPGPPECPSLNMSVSADGGNISFVNPGGPTMLNLNSGGGGYFMGNLGFGTSDAANILTVVQRSATQPIADSWTTYSSRRWKKNIRTLDGALSKVMRLRGVSYDWKADDKHDIGLIAEEVGEVIPEIVTYEANGTDAKSVDYARLTALLIEAVKQQQTTIDELKSEVSELKTLTPRHASISTEK